jgi:hypothetical protein
MPEEPFRCARCGKDIARGADEPGTLVQCGACKAHVMVPSLPIGAASRPVPPSPFQAPHGGKHPTPLWVFFGYGFALCAIALGLLFFLIQKNSRNQTAFTDAMQTAENAETPAEGLRLVGQLLETHLDAGQKAQTLALRTLLQKRAQVENALAAARREEAARQAAAAAKPRPVPPAAPPPPEPTLADAQSAYDRGIRLACGDGVATDEAAALVWIGKAAGIGLPQAQHDLAAMYAGGIGCATNLAAAVPWGRKAAEQGDAEAQAWLGQLYANGTGVPADPAQAAQWNEKAAAQGQAEAALNLGVQYANGRGVRQDYARAFRLFTAAAAGSNAEALVNLGTMFWKGLGVEPDPTNAFRCFQQAQERGSVQGTFAMGLLYGIGSGVARDRQMAAACCLTAARNGLVGAQKKIGRMYLAGSGVPWSEQDAIYWYRMAAAQGDETARQAVDAYRNTHLPPVYATCEMCSGKGAVVRACPECHGAGTLAETVASKSITTCVCGWQMVNGRCPNCGRTASATQTIRVPCAACHGSGRQTVACRRCGGSGQVRVSGPAQATFAQMVDRPDPGIALANPTNGAPVRLHPFRAGVNRGGGI